MKVELDGRTLSKALAYAIRTIERLPQSLREEAELERMRTALWGLVPHEPTRQYLLDGALGHITGKPVGEVREALERHYREHPDKMPADKTVIAFPLSDNGREGGDR